MREIITIVSAYLTTRVVSGLLSSSHCHQPSFLNRCESCKRGWWGDRCDFTCRGHCDIAGCHQSNGSCWGCGAWYYNEGCTTPCPDNCYPSYQHKVFCNRTTGACLEGCRHGWCGDWCEKKCSTGCEGGICYQHNGNCIKSCNPGWSGEWCDVPCPEHCASTKDGGRHCHWNTRKCRDGCIDGWRGDHCELECSSNCISKSEGCRTGWTGDRCDVRCPSGCRDGTCDQDGKQRCSFGCQPGFHGHHCDKTCNINCINRECVHDHQLKYTVCTNGCVEGWWSHDCSKKCLDYCEVCGRETGTCLPDTTQTDAPLKQTSAAGDSSLSLHLDQTWEQLASYLPLASCLMNWAYFLL